MPFIAHNKNKNPILILKPQDKKSFITLDQETNQIKIISANKLNKPFISFKKISEEDYSLHKKSKIWFPTLIFRFKSILLQSLCLSILINFLSISTPLFLLAIFYNATTSDPTSHSLILLSMGIALTLFISFVLQSSRDYLHNYLNARIDYILNNEVLNRFLRMEKSSVDKYSFSDKINYFQDFNVIKEFFNSNTLEKIIDLPLSFILIFFMYLLADDMAYIPLGTYFIFVLTSLFYGPLIKKLNAIFASNKKNSTSFLIESFAKFKTIKYSGKESNWISQFNTIQSENIEYSNKSLYINNFFSHITSLIISLATLTTIYTGVYKVLNQTLAAPTLMASIFLLWKILDPLRSILTISTTAHKAKQSIRRLDKFMDTPIESNPISSGIKNPIIRGNLDFSGITSRYINNPIPSLSNVSFKLSQYKSMFIYGDDGSGKSTLLKIIMGMVDYQLGHALLDGANIKQFNPIILRKNISFIPKNSYFFNKSIEDNFRHFNPEISEKEITQWLTIFKLEHLIPYLKFSLDDALFPINVSDSEKKMITFIRGLIKPSEILIIEELSSSLSKEHLNLAISSLKKIKHKKTIIITDKINYFQPFCDLYLHLEKGRVINTTNKQGAP